MDKTYRVLVVNPGSTTTKIAVFENETALFTKTVAHDPEVMKNMPDIQGQLEYRTQTIEEELAKAGYNAADMDIYAGRGGGLLPIIGGTYEVNDIMLEHAANNVCGAPHPAQLGCQICSNYVKKYGGRAFIVNGPDTDEYIDVARVTGLKGFYRKSHIHALNQKEVAIRYCAAHGLKYEETDLVVAHIGGGISVTAHCHGRMIDSNDIIGGEGPMTPTRAGALPAADLQKMCYSGDYSAAEMKSRINKVGGLFDHLGTSDGLEVQRRIDEGDPYAKLIFDTLIYQISKEIGARAVSNKGGTKAIILTGGMSHNKYICSEITKYVGWIAPVEIMAGEFELEALAAGSLRVVRGEEEAKVYTGEPVWKGFDFIK